MPELGFSEQQLSARSSASGIRAREASPNSVSYAPESNFSLFSSTSASADRCSFASDAHDRDSFASEHSSVNLHFLAFIQNVCAYFGMEPLVHALFNLIIQCAFQLGGILTLK